MTSGLPERTPDKPSEIGIALDDLASGWYLVYWRVISVDGHPVRGAFTFAVGPSPGPPPQFDIAVAHRVRGHAGPAGRALDRPALADGLRRPAHLPAARRPAAAAPRSRRVAAGGRRTALAVSLAAAARLGARLRQPRHGRLRRDVVLGPRRHRPADARLGVRARLLRPRPGARAAGGRRAAGGACSTARSASSDRSPRSSRRPVRVAAAAAVLTIPGLAGHAGQYSPRGVTLSLDWIHLRRRLGLDRRPDRLTVVAWKAATRRVACMVVVVPRFSRVALVAVVALMASGHRHGDPPACRRSSRCGRPATGRR